MKVKLKFILFICFLIFLIIKNSTAQITDTLKIGENTIIFNKKDSVNAYIIAGFTMYAENKIENYFKHSFKEYVTIFLFASRNELDHAFQKEWNMQNWHSQCWMVASGISDKMYMLSPSAWQKEACEHDPDNFKRIRELITHEFVHCFHSQHNANKNMSGFSEMSWFVEGLAVYVSDQLTAERKEKLKKIKAANSLPDQLDLFWNGKNRYTLSGSIMEYVILKYGVEKIYECLKFQTTEDILKHLNITETELLQEWKNSI